MGIRVIRGAWLPLALALTIAPAAANAFSSNFSFFGNYTLEDLEPDGFSESLMFDNPFGSHSGAITSFAPAADALFNDAGVETVEIATLTLDPGSPFDFSPTVYAAGFKVYDDDDTLLFTADLTVLTLAISGGTGDINPAFELNLTNITAGPSYTAGDSTIIDEFLAAPGGATNITLQLAGADLAAAIQNGDTINSTYSGSALPVPEPGSLVLVVGGLAGLAYSGRRRTPFTGDRGRRSDFAAS